jgi:hypothetical protein
MKRAAVIALLALAAFFLFFHEPETKHPVGMVAPQEPLQEAVPQGIAPVSLKNFNIQPIARFVIRARVLSRKTYGLGPEHALSPLDLAMGGGPMSDSFNLDRIKITQGGRWYRYRYSFDDPPAISPGEIAAHSANMHMIPANDAVEKDLRRIRKGDVVELTGYLVSVTGDNGFTWASSVTRLDTGNRSCEIVYVEKVLFDQ